MQSSLIVEGILRRAGFQRSSAITELWVADYVDDVAHITLSPHLMLLLDEVYAQGHRDGWERGAYEEFTKEDV